MVTRYAAERMLNLISDWVHNDCNLTGLLALNLQVEFLNTFYESLLDRRAPGDVLTLVQQHKMKVINEIETSHAEMPDLVEQCASVQRITRESEKRKTIS